MNSLKIYLFIFFNFLASPFLKAQQSTSLHIDSLPINLSPYCNVSFSPLINDTVELKSSWIWFKTNSNLKKVDEKLNPFKGYAVFNWQISIPAKWVNTPLLLNLNHSGSSKIFLDNKLMASYGQFGLQQEGFNPSLWPVNFTLADTLPHQLTIFYQHKNWEDAFSVLEEFGKGVSASITLAQTGVRGLIADSFSNNLIYGILGGFFMALTLLHFIYFLFNPGEKSNLWFSLFIGCLAWMFISINLSPGLGDIQIAKIVRYSTIPVTLICMLSLQAFIYDILTVRKQWLLYLNFLVGAAVLYFYVNVNDLSISIIAYLIFGVALEVIVRIIIALIRQQAGVRIIAFGLFMPLMLLVAIYISAYFYQSFEVHVSISNPEGVLFLFILVFTIFSPPVSMSVYLAWKYAVLSARTIEQEREKKKILEGQKEILELEVAERTKEAVAEKEKTEKLLLNILPKPIAEELKKRGEVEAKNIEPVSILFTDFVNFTGISATLTAQELVNELHACFKAFDSITATHGLEKIKTIGDAYLAVGGLTKPDPNHAENTVNAAIEILNFMEERKKEGGLFEIRLGIHSGSVAAGIVGTHKFAYDIWGDAVNTASRMESSGEVGKINISFATAKLLPSSIKLISRGALPIKNRGSIEMFFVDTKH